MPPRKRNPTTPDASALAATPPTVNAATPPLFSPRTFLKARSPERFSDSISVPTARVPRTTLEYHLDTLTSRGQENDFEQFARKLAERTLCPNLLPHTGPTGGGDSKVDAETYPVSDQLAMAWFVGDAREAAKERWAFAFSAKRDWKPKVKSDVKKLVGTDRGYAKAMFITNQFVSDRDRAATEDALRKEYGIDVRVYDRTWILEKVYGNGLEQLAIDELRMEVPKGTEVRFGPNDTGRLRALEETEKEIDLALRENRQSPALVDNMLYAARLARALERPRQEIEGRFERARAVAESLDSAHHKLLVAYQEAFTTYFWFEDYPVFLDKLAVFDRLVEGSDNVGELQRATTLWSCLFAATKQSLIDPAKADFDKRTKRLLAAIDVAAEDTNRPSSALDAEGLAIQMRLTEASPNQVNDHLVRLRDVIERSAGLLGFPMDVWIEIIANLGQALGHLSAYDKLHDRVVAIAGEREGEVTAARLLLARGTQQMDQKRYYPAIRTLGQALTRLYKEESRDELFQALYLLGAAYEGVGLLWAARGSLLNASAIAAGDLATDHSVTHEQRLCFDRMRWVELRLGRVPHALAWHEVTITIKNALAHDGANLELLRKGDFEFDATLGILLLRTDFWELKWLDFLPEVLEDLFLPIASMTLRFLLGHGDTIEREADSPEDVEETFHALAAQPAASELPPVADICSTQSATLTSRVLGCEIQIESSSTDPCRSIAETILAGLESLLSTGLEGSRIIARTPRLSIRLHKATLQSEPLSFEASDKDGLPHFDVRAGDWKVHAATREVQMAFRRTLQELLVMLMAHAYLVPDPEKTLKSLMGGERALERAVNFTGSIQTVGTVLGDQPKFALDDWKRQETKRYPLLRTSPWVPKSPQPSPENGPTNGSGPNPAPKGDPESAWQFKKHSDIRMESLIRPPLWDRAVWHATVFVTEQNDAEPPAMALLFRNHEPAEQIFRQLLADVGRDDPNDILRVSIIQGVSAAHPHSYRIVIGSNPTSLRDVSEGRFLVMMSRHNQMDPMNSENLIRFLRSYGVCKEFAFIPAFGEASNAEFAPALGIKKKSLHVFDAWQLTPGDIETVAIRDDDKPVIPDDRKQDAPVLDVLKAKRERDQEGWHRSKSGANDSPPVASKRPSAPPPKSRFKKRKPKK